MAFKPIQPISPTTSGFKPMDGTPVQTNMEKLPFKFPMPAETREEKVARLQAEAAASQAESKKANSVKGFLKNTVTAPAMENLPFVGGAIGLSKTVNKLIDNPTQRESQNVIQLQGENAKLLKEIRTKDAAGEDTTKLKKVFNSNVDAISQSVQALNEYQASLPSNGQALGQVLHTGLDVLTVGTYGKKAAGMKNFILNKGAGAAPTAVEAATNMAKKKAGLFTVQGAKNVGTAAIKGGALGYPYDIVLGLEGKRGEDRTGVNALKPGAATAGGAIIAGGIAAAGGAVNSAKNAIKTHREQAAKQFDDLVGQIVQGKQKDIPKAKAALASIDTSDIKTYRDLTDALDDKIEVLSSKLDDTLDKNPTLMTIDDLTLKTDVKGKPVTHNYVQDSIDQLKELYTKTNDPIGLEQINQIEAKAATQGLTIREINDLAREYGSEFSSKAFSKAGEPLTSVNAQALENTRMGIKATARNIFDDPIYKETDQQISNLIRTRDLTDKVAEKAADLQQKIKTRGLGERVGRALFKIVNTFSGGSLKGFGESFITRGEGLKTLNAMDLEKHLQSNLDSLQSIIDNTKMPEADIISRLDGIINGTAIAKAADAADSIPVYRYEGGAKGADWQVMKNMSGQDFAAFGKNGMSVALDDTSSAMFGDNLKSGSLPKGTKLYDLTKVGDRMNAGDDINYRAWLKDSLKKDIGDFVEYMAKKGYDGVKYLSDDGSAVWADLRKGLNPFK